MPAKRTQLTAYGKPLDRDKLKVLADASFSSESQVIVSLVRREYERLYGETPPDVFLD